MNLEWILDWNFLGSSASRWFAAGGVFVVVAGVLLILRSWIPRVFEPLARRTNTRVDELARDLGRSTHFIFIVVLALFAASLLVQVADHTRSIFEKITVVAFIVQIVIITNSALRFWLSRGLSDREDRLAQNPTTRVVIGVFGRVLLLAFAALLILDNLGINVTTLITGLGIGGIAIALATQNVLGDILASLSIVIDKPFVVGDFIIIGDFMGTVEHVGLKTTRLRSLSGEQIIFSNNDLLGSRIRNYKRMYERRVVFTLDTVYGTSQELVQEIPGIIRQAVEARGTQVRFDRAHFKAFGASALVFECVYWVLSPDYNVFMDIHQAVNHDILSSFRARNIDFAFPTQTIHVERSEPTLTHSLAESEVP